MAQASAVRINLPRRALLWISQTVESAEGAASCGFWSQISAPQTSNCVTKSVSTLLEQTDPHLPITPYVTHSPKSEGRTWVWLLTNKYDRDDGMVSLLWSYKTVTSVSLEVPVSLWPGRSKWEGTGFGEGSSGPKATINWDCRFYGPRAKGCCNNHMSLDADPSPVEKTALVSTSLWPCKTPSRDLCEAVSRLLTHRNRDTTTGELL